MSSRGMFVQVAQFQPAGEGFTPDSFSPTALISFDSLVSAVKDQIAIDAAADAPAKRKTQVRS
jgi:hypothetical protein